MTEMRLKHAPWLRASATRVVMAALGGYDPEPKTRFVGGCVRNTLLGLTVGDLDLATVYDPQTVIKLAEAAQLKPVPTGLSHGTITVIAGGKPFEVTTLRIDVATDGRRAEVAYTSDWVEDARRRDFTINAIYADGHGALLDPVGGVADIAAHRVRFIGDPVARIREDYLRILRFFRIHAWYGDGALDAAGLAACQSERGGLRRLSAERIQKELLRLLEAKDPVPVLDAMREAGVLEIVLAEAGDLRPLASLVRVEAMLGLADPMRRLGALIAVDSARASEVADRLRLSNAMRERLMRLREITAQPLPDAHEQALKRRLFSEGEESVTDRLILSAARGEIEAPVLGKLLRIAARWQPPRFPVTGHDVTALGASGAKIGDVLAALQSAWLESDFKASKKDLMAQARALIGAP